MSKLARNLAYYTNKGFLLPSFLTKAHLNVLGGLNLLQMQVKQSGSDYIIFWEAKV